MAAVYYHAGMATEALLKAYLWRKHRWNTFPSRQSARYLYYHDLETMMRHTGLEEQLKKDPERWASWQTVREWSHGPRYSDADMPRQVAWSMARSVRHPDYGVFPWLLKLYHKLP
jgi:hypothetical protein